MNADIGIVEGGPNVFADLGLPDAEELLVKSQLALQIARVLKERASRKARLPRGSACPSPSSRTSCAAASTASAKTR